MIDQMSFPIDVLVDIFVRLNSSINLFLVSKRFEQVAFLVFIQRASTSTLKNLIYEGNAKTIQRIHQETNINLLFEASFITRWSIQNRHRDILSILSINEEVKSSIKQLDKDILIDEFYKNRIHSKSFTSRHRIPNKRIIFSIELLDQFVFISQRLILDKFDETSKEFSYNQYKVILYRKRG